MSTHVIQLVLNGLPLANPHVGQGVYTLRLISALARRSEINFTVVARPDVDIPNGAPMERFVFLPRARTPKNNFLAQIFWSERLLRFVAREFPSAIFHSPGPIAGIHRPNRTIVTLHDCIYRAFPNYNGRFLVRKLFLRLTERFAAQSAMVLTDSEFSKQELINRAGIVPDRIDVLYPWVGDEYFKPISDTEVSLVRRSLNLPDRFWLYVGGYDYRKNLEFLLRAYAQANKKQRLPALVLAGKIPPRGRTTCDVIGTLRQIGLTEKQVLFPGPISHADLPTLYRAACLFIFPSLMEGFGLPPAEATAAGTPVLVSNRSSLPEVVQRSDCWFDPTVPESLVEKLGAAAENEQQFETRLDDRFTEDVAIKRYLTFLNSVAGKNHVSP